MNVRGKAEFETDLLLQSGGRSVTDKQLLDLKGF
jgi:hypothetical protein